MNSLSRGAYTLGVIVCQIRKSPPFHEASYFKQLSLEGNKLGITLIVFSPKAVDWSTRSLLGWRYESKTNRWKVERHSLPYLIYDRCYYLNRSQYFEYKPFVYKLANDPQIRLLGRPLSGKWQTYTMLKRKQSLNSYLPETIRYHATLELLPLFKKWGTILIKPNGGSHGRGVASLRPEKGGIRLLGRSPRNQLFNRWIGYQELKPWLHRFIGSSRYIVQPCLDLNSSDGRPFDVRILVQKNEKRNWVVTGMAIRTGRMGTLTSNLHGGGKAERAIPFLSKQFSREVMKQILLEIDWLSTQVPIQIEREHGSLVELGIDIGISPQGRIWILEVNSKPGRSVFLLTGEKQVRLRSIQNPIRYARTLLEERVGGVV